jgi:hypothetical protein
MTQQPYYPPAPQQAYPPQQVTQPQYAPPPAQPAAPQYPGYPPQGQQAYGIPAQIPAQQPAPQPLAQGSIDDYYNQPSTGGGAGLKFTGPNNQPMIGQSYVFQVSRPIGNGDIQQQTDNQNRPLFFKDGRPKFVMIVPVQLLEPSPNHPDGLAKWYVKGAARDELARAMAEAGAPEGPPENGAVIRVTLTGTRQSGPGMNPAHVFAVQYVRPQGATQGAAPAAPAQPAAQATPPAPVQQQYQPPAEQQYAQPVAPQQVPQQPAPAAPQAQVPVQQQGAPQPPPNLSPEQQQFLAKLQAQQG